MFSMPPGTSSDKVLSAVRNFAREEFWGQHRYAFVLHTDEAHPHVHLVLKAVSEEGIRLNIRKSTLRHWRSEFAQNLRALGVEANATERAVRGQEKDARKDGVYRASLRGESTYLDSHAEGATIGTSTVCRTKAAEHKLVETRRQVSSAWKNLAGRLAKDGELELARDIERFTGEISRAITEREQISRDLGKRNSTREQHPTR